MRGSLLQCSYVSSGSETSQTALAAGREKYHRAKGQVCARNGPSQTSRSCVLPVHLTQGRPGRPMRIIVHMVGDVSYRTVLSVGREGPADIVRSWLSESPGSADCYF